MGPGRRALVGATKCENAYVFIPSASNKAFSEDVTADRFCGNGLAGEIVTCKFSLFFM